MTDKRGKLIVIEGIDGSGKETQTSRLYERLIQENQKVLKIQFPRYHKESAALIKMYLNGSFGSEVDSVNPFIASTFYAVDRYASFKEEWEDFYKQGGIVISDRYTTSNMIHQMAKISGAVEREKYLNWLWNFEFELFELPIPDLVIFLDMPPQYGSKLISNRSNKFSGEMEKDIHEKNQHYLLEAYQSACFVAEKYNWQRIYCVDKGRLKTIDEIHQEIYSVTKEFFFSTNK
ncbi:MAG: deoxynucleoside kinase [Clostridia bacterium]|jgi:dTMP kinase|nr:deoxynucleoside kinase [Clostridia bacterium]